MANSRTIDPLATPGPRVRALLDGVRGRLVRQVWMHGLGTAALGFGLWLLFAFLADRWLHLPRAIRVFHGVVLVAVPVWLLRGHLFALLRRVPDLEGVALLVERRLPASGDRLVSAVQLAGQGSDPVRGDLVQRMQREAEELAGTLDVDAVFAPRGPRTRLLRGAVAVALVAVVLGAQPAMARIFAQRMLGQDVSWPRRTTLTVEVAAGADGARIDAGDEEILVRIARGGDLEVAVRAEGKIPDSVMLEFDSGVREEVMGGAREVFRTLLRGLQQDTSFVVSGGDDRRRVPRVRIEVLQPPDVAGVAFTIEPPAYTGLAPRVLSAPEVEAPEGARVIVHVLPDPLDARGIARTFPDARELPLVLTPWPAAALAAAEGASETAPGAVPVAEQGLGFELVADDSSRFRFELVDGTGLSNPDPGLFGVEVVPDRRPELSLLAPAQATLEVVAGGAIPLRLRAADDHGVVTARYIVQDARGEGPALLAGDLPLRELADAPASASGHPRAVLARARLEVDDLGLDASGARQPLSLGQGFTLTALVADGREPQPGESRTAPVSLRVVSIDDLQRSIREGLSRVGEDAEKLVRLVEGLGRDLADAEAALAGENASTEAGILVGLAADARRSQGDARSIARDLAALSERMLYARIDGRSGALLERLERLLDDVDGRGFPIDAWHTLSGEYAAGALGQADLAGELVTLVGLALEVADPRAEAVADALQRAREGDGPGTSRAAVQEARTHHIELADAAEQLLGRLGEWDDYQSVLGLTRDLLGRQRSLEKRIREQSSKD